MQNFRIEWATSPWLMFLIIPALALTLWPYFRIAKRYRRTRNRICSIVLHVIIMVLSISVLSGMYFSFESKDSQNELILLVDVSFSGEDDEDAKAEKDFFIRQVLNANSDRYKIGIVTFGYTQNYVAEFSYDVNSLFEQYSRALAPDDTATDIAAALKFVWDPQMHEGLFNYPDHGKILLISDGLQTDGEALSIIKNIALDGITVDTKCISPASKTDVMVSGINVPDVNVVKNETVELTVDLQSNITGEGTLVFTDEYEDNFGVVTLDEKETTVELKSALQSVRVEHAFKESGLHKLYVTFTTKDDSVNINNDYFAYYELFVHENLLIIERFDSESEPFVQMFSRDLDPDNNLYNVEVKNISDETLPNSVDKLRDYDQIILVNISHEDMDGVEGFEDNLYSYVNEHGGGLLTVGGPERDKDGDVIYDDSVTDDRWTPLAHSYLKDDMKGTKYQSMLPVNITDYTPPIAVMLLIDSSGSMGETVSGDTTRLDVAKSGALSCLGALTDRDYCGVGFFNQNYNHALNPTPVTQKKKIERAIESARQSASSVGTMFTIGISRAIQVLSAVTNVERRHIIIVTDGIPGDVDEYLYLLEDAYEKFGITCSVAGINTYDMEGVKAAMDRIATYGHGNHISSTGTSISDFADKMYAELQQKTLSGLEKESIIPTIYSQTSVVAGIPNITRRIDGYYTSKAKTTGKVEVTLTAGSVPLYAQWSFGRGRVGSFMSDVNFSTLLLGDTVGIKLFNNIVAGLMPSDDIRAKDISAVLTEENYTTRLSVFTTLEEGQYLELEVESPDEDGVMNKISPDRIQQTTASRFTFTIFDAGIHNVTIIKRNEAGDEVSRCVAYKAFSYSKEYDVFRNVEEGATLLTALAESGNGTAITDIQTIFENTNMHQIRDPRLVFIIIVLVLFLLDVAVRKFKFKWPHEIIRGYRERKAMERR